jgi:hypothetical protein
MDLGHADLWLDALTDMPLEAVLDAAARRTERA